MACKIFFLKVGLSIKVFVYIDLKDFSFVELLFAKHLIPFELSDLHKDSITIIYIIIPSLIRKNNTLFKILL